MNSFFVPSMVVGSTGSTMEETTCTECNDKLALPARYEDIPEGMETEHEHLTRTGHVPFDIPQIAACEHCEHVWCYWGSKETTSCPACEYKTEIDPGVDIEIRAVRGGD